MAQTTVGMNALERRSAELTPEIDSLISATLRSGVYVGGPEVQDFERSYSKYLGGAHVVGVGNGLDALSLGLSALRSSEGTEVLVPAQTFRATWLSVLRAGLKPVPVDIDSQGNISVEDAEKKFTPETVAVIAVHLHGLPADPKLVELCRSLSVTLVEDAAQAHGAKWLGQNAGCVGTFSAFSFYPTKNLGGIGDAGAVVTLDPTIAKRVRSLANYGNQQESDLIDLHAIPMNSRLDPIQALYLKASLPKLEDWNAKRRSTARAYLAALQSDGYVRALHGNELCDMSVWHHFVLLCENRARVRRYFDGLFIDTLIHYDPPPFLDPVIQRACGVRWQPSDFPTATRHSRQALSIPVHPWMSDEERGRVLEALASAHSA